MNTYFEPQYHILSESQEEVGLVTLGPMASYTWHHDPKRLLFVLSRYKFAARMLEGCRSVIEIGCGDGFASRIVRQHVDSLTLTDADPLMIEAAKSTSSVMYPVVPICHNFVTGSLSGAHVFDGAYLLDVLEHIPIEQEGIFFRNLSSSLTHDAKVVVGMPSAESQVFASQGSREGHINCKTKEELGLSLNTYFSSVSLFCMNDEVVHTGFARMANYVFGVCACPKSRT